MAAKKYSSVSFDDVKWPPATTDQLQALGYEFESKIGYGSFATVYSVLMSKHKETKKVACKFIDLKSKTARYREKFFPREIEATRTLRHKYLVHVYEVVMDTTGKLCFIFMQLAKSDLLKEIEKASKIAEPQGRKWTHQLIEGLMFLHANHWVHRDLKVENMLISDENTILISDFGFMRQQRPDVLSDTHCGSLAYAAPEVIAPKSGSKKGSYDAYKADVWSVGVVLYVMHTGEMPFDDTDGRKVRAEHEKVKSLVDKHDLSDKLKSLIKGLLVLDPSQRMTLAQALVHPWVKQRGSVLGSIKSAFSSMVGSSSGSSGSLRMLSSASTSSKSSTLNSNGSLKVHSKSSSGTGSRAPKHGSQNRSKPDSKNGQSDTGSKTASKTSQSNTGSKTRSKSGQSNTGSKAGSKSGHSSSSSGSPGSK